MESGKKYDDAEAKQLLRGKALALGGRIQILKDGADAANAVAKQTLFATKVAMGFVTPEEE